MRIPKKTHELIRQNEQIVKKSQKHDANLQKNSTLYFQIGLIVCLLGAYGLFEMQFETTISKEVVMTVPDDKFDEVTVEKFKVYEEPKAEVKPKLEKTVLLIKEPVIVDNDHVMKEALEIDTPEQNTSSDEPIDPNDIVVLEEPEDVPVPLAFIQNAPIYPGCEKAKNNKARKKCMSEKITRLIQRKFHGDDIALNYGLTGMQKIDVQFTIDNTGKVNNIKTRAPHPKLENEAIRVINLIPEMTPGKQNNKNVGVIYTLPIKFEVY